MPYFRGIEISVVASHAARRLPEYPHPDGSSVQVRHNTATNEASPRLPQSPSAVSTASSEFDPSSTRKINPKISVYIPSNPGEQFWLQYVVGRSCPSRYVFFKLFMNGHHIVSWGIDTDTRSEGTVTRALYEPGPRWTDQAPHHGMSAVGIESRYFHFMMGVDQRSVAEDGGLIEVQAFRCHGRRRVAARLSEYYNQERYGIASSTGGLLENPEDTTYYEYHLQDARDSPYATFRFHYRSSKNLEQLSLMPPRPMSSPAKCSSLRQAFLSHSPGANPARRSETQDMEQFSFGVESLDRDVFRDYNGMRSQEDNPNRATNTDDYALRSPPDITHALAAHPSTSKYQQPIEPEEEAQVEEPQRLPPDVPDAVHKRQPSRSSLRSNCPSLTASLISYVDSGAFDAEEIKLGTAKSLIVPSASMQALELNNESTHSGEDESLSDYATSPGSTVASQSPEFPPSDAYLATTGSGLERGLHQFGSPLARATPRKSTPAMEPSSSDKTLVTENDEDKTASLILTEGEWLKRSPSPKDKRRRWSLRQWSPRPRRQEDQAELSDTAKYECGRSAATGCGFSGGDEGKKDAKVTANKAERSNSRPVGNWI